MTKKTEKEVLKVYDTWLQSYLNGDVETYNSFLDDDYHFIGSATNEEFLNRKDATQFFADTGDQFAGKTELRNETKTIEYFGELIFITHVFDAWFLNKKKWVFYSRFRFSSALRNNKEGWRFIYQHFSIPDSKAAEGETIGYDKVNEENQELREAIKRRTFELETKNRELEVEAALERVRSRSMAMYKSDELKEVIQVVYDQFIQLNITVEHTGFILDYKQREDMHIWLADRHEVPAEVSFPYFNCAHWNSFNEAKKNGKDFFANKLDFKEKNKFYKDLFKRIPDLPKEVMDYYFSCNALAISTVLLDNIGLYIENFEGIPYSNEENDILMRFGKVFQQTYTRFLDLQKAEEQTRKAQIETALERVRSRSMAMYHSEEHKEVIGEAYAQISSLNILIDTCALMLNIEGSKDRYSWVVSAEQQYPTMVLLHYHDHPIGNLIHNARRRPGKPVTQLFSGEENRSFYKHMFKTSEIGGMITAKRQDAVLNAPSNIITTVSLKHSGLYVANFRGHYYSEQENETVLKFLQVIEQSFTRFLDLQKAEAQTRETEIELGLEKVRSRAMAMQTSDELSALVDTVFNELTKLDLTLSWCMINIIDEPTMSNTVWAANPETGKPPERYHMLFEDYRFHHEMFKAWQEKQPKWVFILKGKEKEIYDDYLFNKTEFKKVSKPVQEWHRAIKQFYASFTFSNFGGLQTVSEAPLSDDSLGILNRFGKVFDLTYTRFNDLLKAEAQAREAQIEAALERVRSKAMAMRSSEDIGEATTVLFKEIEKLDIKTMRCGIVIIHENQIMDTWTTSTAKNDKIIRVSGQINMKIHPLFKNVYRSWKAKESFTEYKLQGKDGENYYEALSKEVTYNLPTPSIVKEIHFMTGFLFNEGAIFTFTKNKIPENAKKIFKRFAMVFGLTYQRYRELIESEKREKEAIKESTLDRVRAEIASMRTTADLNRITPLVWKELTALGVPFFRCGIFIVREEEEMVHAYLSTPTGESLAALDLGFEEADVGIIESIIDNWRKQTIFSEEWNREKFLQNMGILMKRDHIVNHEKYQHGATAPERLVLHMVPFQQGMLYVGNSEPLIQEHIDLMKDLANAFSVAYSRYEDFNKLEKAKEKVEEALTDLKSTQKQLVQSEKMASLGELTAGIAHEIQNPLNFVNNFSEVSKELLEEMLQEIENGNMEDAKAITEDIIQNLDKINHHGKRADGIVKGMLQHSRRSTGKKEPTDINTLADEYQRLAYHGLRAKDKTFNATLNTDFDTNIKTIKVIPQDIGRVILNLLTNAFHAVKDKKQHKPDGYEPTVLISTKKEKDAVIIKVTDNGNGIPKKVIDKIFQPFFTTKPIGEGTGLGLSMSYDIITKSHDGELKVTTKLGEGTIFTIKIPTNIKQEKS